MEMTEDSQEEFEFLNPHSKIFVHRFLSIVNNTRTQNINLLEFRRIVEHIVLLFDVTFYVLNLPATVEMTQEIELIII